MANKKKAKEIIDGIVIAMAVVIFVVIAGLIVASITGSTVFNDLTSSYTVNNETGGFINSSGYTLGQAGVTGFVNPALTYLVNTTDNSTIGLANATVSGAGVVTNATVVNWNDEVLVSYTYTASTGRNVAGLNITAISNTFGEFVTNLVAFLAVIGTILGVVWLVLYVKKLFSKKEGLSDIAA